MPNKRLLLNAEQLTVFRYLYAAYVTATDLAAGPITEDMLPKLRIRAEPSATASLPTLAPHFFEPLREDEWQSAGFALPTLPSRRPDPEDPAFSHALSVTRDIELCLEEDAPSGELGLEYESDWTSYSLPKDESRVGTWEANWSSYEWRITKFWARRDGGVPHLSVVAAHGHIADGGRLLRSEVIAATRSMMAWLKLHAKKGNLVCPVQMLSACGMRLRIIHGFFDGEDIVLRFTPLMDMSPTADERPQKLLLLLRHLVGHAVGDAASLSRPLQRPGPMPELEKLWLLRANPPGKKKIAMAGKKPTAKGQANGHAMQGSAAGRAANETTGVSNAATKGSHLKKPLTPNGGAVVLKKAGKHV